MEKFRNRLLDLIEVTDPFELYTGSVTDLLNLEEDDQRMVIRGLIMSYGVYDTARLLDDCLNMCTWHQGWFSVDMSWMDISTELIYVDCININEYRSCDSNEYDTTKIHTGIIIKKGGYDIIENKYEVDRIILSSQFPTTEGHRVYLV